MFRPPPRPPAKSCPPKSRVFKRTSELLKAQVLSFNKGREVTGTPLQAATYDTAKLESYFEQAFIKEKEIGAGYFGTVYRVKSREDQAVYAVKIARDRYKGPSDRIRKLEEVRKHQFLPPHSNLVRFYNSWEEKGRLYQQFELCQGNLLEFVDKEDKLDQFRIWDFLVDLLQAVQHLHDHDLVHMDIKPENIFIGMDGICKLGDFGLMIDLASGDKDGMEGDPKYLAPEVLQGSYTKACDVFSLGVTILEVACDLDLPRGGQLWHDLRKSGPDPELTLHLLPELRRVLQLMMTRDPDRRPAIRQILELPSVSQAVRRRARQLTLNKIWFTITKCVAMVLPMITFILSLILDLVYPLRDLMKQTPSPPGTPPPIKTVNMMDAFSDDETDCTIETESSRGSELAVPLSCSGSDTSDHRRGDTPLRGSSSTPPPRHRSRCLARTPGVSPGKRLFFSEQSPQVFYGNQSPDLGTSSRINMDITDSDQEADEEFLSSDDEVANGFIRPQSLVDTFDHFSADDD